jgi:hypothetical protein
MVAIVRHLVTTIVHPREVIFVHLLGVTIVQIMMVIIVQIVVANILSLRVGTIAQVMVTTIFKHRVAPPLIHQHTDPRLELARYRLFRLIGVPSALEFKRDKIRLDNDAILLLVVA